MFSPRILQDHETPEYFKGYINLVEENDVLKVLREGLKSTPDFLESLSDEQLDHAYAPGKWTLKESFLHLIDTERIMAYRALRIARNDRTPLMGFNQDDYVAYYNAGERSQSSLIREYRTVREASLSLFEHLDDEAVKRMGTASGYPVSVLSLAFIIAGHERHHLKLFREKYLSSS